MKKVNVFNYDSVISILKRCGYDGVSVGEFCSIFGIDDGCYIIDNICEWDKMYGRVIMVRDIFCLRSIVNDFEW